MTTMSPYEGLGDNFVIRVNGKTKERFKKVIDLVDSNTAVGYALDNDGKRLVFYRYESDKAIPFPFAMDREGIADFAWAWLKQVSYPPEPDHDGSNGKGWIVYTNEWGEVEGHGYRSMIAIEPEWREYHK